MVTKPISIAFSAHKATDRENIGDTLSAQSIPILRGSMYHQIRCLPNDNAIRPYYPTIYGGGGMIRPGFAKREIWADAICWENKYQIQGVGINKDLDAADYTAEDIYAIFNWFSSSEDCSVRDFRSQEMIFNICRISPRFEPCPTFQVIRLIQKKITNIKKKEIGIVLSSGHTETYKNRLDKIEKIVSFIVGYIGIENAVIICHDNADYIWSSMRFQCAIEKPSNLTEVKTFYSQCESIISMRGHGIIFAAACGVPAIAISFCDKIDALFETHYGLPLPEFDIEEPTKAIKKLFKLFCVPKQFEWSLGSYV